MANRCLATEPWCGWRDVGASEHRTRRDFAPWGRPLGAGLDPAAARIVLVMAPLNTPAPASCYAAFPAAEAQRLADRRELHPTPKHGSWLNIAEIELAVLERHCLRQRFGGRAALATAATAWATRRNASGAAVDWRFTTTDARTKRKRLSPAFER